jgi:hypothetical protein
MEMNDEVEDEMNHLEIMEYFSRLLLLEEEIGIYLIKIISYIKIFPRENYRICL